MSLAYSHHHYQCHYLCRYLPSINSTAATNHLHYCYYYYYYHYYYTATITIAVPHLQQVSTTPLPLLLLLLLHYFLLRKALHRYHDFMEATQVLVIDELEETTNSEVWRKESEKRGEYDTYESAAKLNKAIQNFAVCNGKAVNAVTQEEVANSSIGIDGWYGVQPSLPVCAQGSSPRPTSAGIYVRSKYTTCLLFQTDPHLVLVQSVNSRFSAVAPMCLVLQSDISVACAQARVASARALAVRATLMMMMMMMVTTTQWHQNQKRKQKRSLRGKPMLQLPCLGRLKQTSKMA